MAQAETGGKNLPGLTVLALATLAAANWIRPRHPRSSPRLIAEAPTPVTSDDDEGVIATAGGLAAAPVEHAPGFIGVLTSIVDRFNRDNASQTAAGIAYYVFLSIFPGLAVLVSIYGLFGDPTEVERQIAPYAGLLPPQAMKLLSDGLAGIVKNNVGAHFSIALATSLAVAFWSTRNAMASIMVGLNIAYEEPERRSFLVQLIISILLTFGAVIFAAVAVTAVAVIPAVLGFLSLGRFVDNMLFYGRWPVLAAMVVLGFAVLYRFAACRSHPRWRWITWGSAIATILWLGGSFVFSFYVSHFGSYDATYGSLGAVVILLLWFWVSALFMVIGAEIDAELDTRATKTGSALAGTAPSAGPPVEGQSVVLAT